MRQFGRFLGFLFLGSGVYMMIFPHNTRRMIQARAEFARLSPGALRLLGFAYLLIGGTLVSVTRPAAIEKKIREAIPPEIRKAA